MARAVATNFYTPKEVSFQGERVFDLLCVLCGFSWRPLRFRILERFRRDHNLYRKGREEEPQRPPRAVTSRTAFVVIPQSEARAAGTSGTLAPTFNPGRIHEGTVPLAKPSVAPRFPVTIGTCVGEGLFGWRWFC